MNKQIYRYLIGLILILILLPIYISAVVKYNANMFGRDFIKNIAGTLNFANMDYLSFVGAILGGGIGGLFTLWGVSLTIKDQNTQKYIDSFPAKDKALIEIIDTLGNVSRDIRDDEKVDELNIVRIRNLVGLAATVDGFTYLFIQGILIYIESLYAHHKSIPEGEFNSSGNFTLTHDPRHKKIADDMAKYIKDRQQTLFKHRGKLLNELMQKTGL